MVETLAYAAGLGLAAGLVPGPLLALVIAQSLRHGTREGLKVAVAPLLTDVPIVALAVLLVAVVAGSHQELLGAISLAGAAFVAVIAWETIRSSPPGGGGTGPPSRSWTRGAVVNALSPHPYLFWTMVGAPQLILAWKTGPGEAAAFLAGFYACLIGAKAGVAAIVGRSAGILGGRAYRVVLVSIGLLLAAFAVLMTIEGIRLMGSG
jgi:threonine/homoserine/homoserine lactone efflux protein